jgi:hypothetical protein
VFYYPQVLKLCYPSISFPPSEISPLSQKTWQKVSHTLVVAGEDLTFVALQLKCFQQNKLS